MICICLGYKYTRTHVCVHVCVGDVGMSQSSVLGLFSSSLTLTRDLNLPLGLQRHLYTDDFQMCICNPDTLLSTSESPLSTQHFPLDNCETWYTLCTHN